MISKPVVKIKCKKVISEPVINKMKIVTFGQQNVKQLSIKPMVNKIKTVISEPVVSKM